MECSLHTAASRHECRCTRKISGHCLLPGIICTSGFFIELDLYGSCSCHGCSVSLGHWQHRFHASGMDLLDHTHFSQVHLLCSYCKDQSYLYNQISTYEVFHSKNLLTSTNRFIKVTSFIKNHQYHVLQLITLTLACKYMLIPILQHHFYIHLQHNCFCDATKSCTFGLYSKEAELKKPNHIIIGASLSEPHTSVTALRTCVSIYLSMDRPLTVNFKLAHSNISR